MPKSGRKSSLISFQQRFGTEQACIEYLASVRWPTGYKCKKCGCQKAYQLKVQPRVFQCSNCRFQESVTAGTILHRTQLPLVKWFWAAYLMAQDRRGVSAAHVGRELGLHYSTAWTMLHKLRRSLSGKGEHLLQGVVEVDETYYGGKGSSESGGRSLSNENKMLIVMAVERKLAPPSKMPGVKSSASWPATPRSPLSPPLPRKTSPHFSRTMFRQGPTSSPMAGLATIPRAKVSSTRRWPWATPRTPASFFLWSTCSSTISSPGSRGPFMESARNTCRHILMNGTTVLTADP